MCKYFEVISEDEIKESNEIKTKERQHTRLEQEKGEVQENNRQGK